MCQHGQAARLALATKPDSENSSKHCQANLLHCAMPYKTARVSACASAIVNQRKEKTIYDGKYTF
jgi:hypothetical protein